MSKRKREALDYEVPEDNKASKRKRETEYEDAPAGKKGKSDGFHFETKGENLDISPIPTSKDKISQPALAEDENMYIPPLGSSVVISGKSGSGKSTLLSNLITDPRFYGPSPEKPKGWFDKIFLFSPTANGDDVQKSLKIDKAHVFTDLDEAPELLEVILSSQQTKLDGAEGADKVEQYAIIFDDVIGDTHFMNEKSFTKCFYQVRHVNCTTFICTQHFKRVPKICRLQANFVFFFQGSASEVEVVTEEFAPPNYTRKEFARLVDSASLKRYSFLTINMKVGWDKRFRRCLDEFIVLDRMEVEEDEKKDDNEENKYEDDNDEEAKAVTSAIDLFKQDGTNEQETGIEQTSRFGKRVDWRY